MGYRSNVSLVLTRDAFAEMCKTIPEHLNKLVEMTDDFLQKENAFLFRWNYIKWVEDSYYPEINAVYRLLNSLDNDQYRFCRIGEDNEDVEERGEYYYNPFETGIVREIHSDVSNASPVDLKVFM